jgi:hypothetical protein
MINNNTKGNKMTSQEQAIKIKETTARKWARRQARWTGQARWTAKKAEMKKNTETANEEDWGIEAGQDAVFEGRWIHVDEVNPTTGEFFGNDQDGDEVSGFADSLDHVYN